MLCPYRSKHVITPNEYSCPLFGSTYTRTMKPKDEPTCGIHKTRTLFRTHCTASHRNNLRSRVSLGSARRTKRVARRSQGSCAVDMRYTCMCSRKRSTRVRESLSPNGVNQEADRTTLKTYNSPVIYSKGPEKMTQRSREEPCWG